MLQLLDPIGRNFIQLNVFFDGMYLYEMSEKASMSGDSLMSQLGGMLSLWLGITIMTGVEFIELLYTIVSHWIRRGKATGLAKAESSKDGGSPTTVSVNL